MSLRTDELEASEQLRDSIRKQQAQPEKSQ
jgi:hypothetical protein